MQEPLHPETGVLLEVADADGDCDPLKYCLYMRGFGVDFDSDLAWILRSRGGLMGEW